MEQRVKTKNISYFNPPVTNTKQDGNVSYEDVYQLVTSGTLVEITNEIRSLCNPDLVKDLKATKLPQLANAQLPIEVTESRIVTLLRLPQ